MTLTARPGLAFLFVLLAVLALFLALSLSGTPAQAQDGSEDEPSELSELSYLTVVVTEEDSDPDNVFTTFTITWNDAEDCSASYNAYLDGVVGDPIHLGSAASEGEQIAASLTNVSAESMGFDAKLYCGTIGSGRLVDSLWIPEYSRSFNTVPISRAYLPKPGTYSTEPGLTALTVSSGTLTPAFHSQTLNYTVPDVANADGRITLTTTTKADYYTVAFIPGSLYFYISFCSHGGQQTSLSYQDETGNPLYPLTDADANTPGFQMDLDEGENVFVIHVWPNCENGHVYKLTVTRAANASENTPATGAPTISGAAQVGETLTVDTSGIADADGLDNVAYTYQWLSSRDTEIQGATDRTYTLAATDEGKAIKVRVSFDDDRNFLETLTSEATATVVTPLTAEFQYAPDKHLGTGVFTFDIAFSEPISISYVTLRDNSLDVTNGSATKAKRMNGQSDLWQITVEPDSDADVTVVLPITEDCAAQDAVCTRDNKKLSNRLELTVPGPEGSGQNSPATGAPTVSGTAQVGETLTASTSDIDDADGMSGAVYSYQWIAGTTDISGATGSSYAPLVADLGKTIKVRVSFDDDQNNFESLTSAPTAAVAAVPPDAPHNLNVSPDDTGTLDVSWEAPARDGGSAITEYRVQWKETAGNWDTPTDVSQETVTGTTHTITGLTDGVEYTVRVIAVNGVGDGPPSSEATGTPRETTPPVLDGAAVASVTLRDQSQKAAAAQIESDDEPYRIGSITVVVAEDISDPDNVVTDLTVTWNDVKDCSTAYNAYFLTNGYDIPTIQTGEPSDDPSAYQVHLGSATSSDSQIAKSLANVEDNRTGFDVKVYCGTVDSGRYVSRVYIPQRWAGPDVHRDKPMPGTYSSEHGLTALTMNPGTLTPTFDSHTLRYTVPDVPNANDQITLTFSAKTGLTAVVMPRAAAWGAGFNVCSLGAFGWDCRGQPYEDEDVLPDADGQAPGLQLNLDEGENQFGIVVWDEMVDYLPVTGIYYLTITRTPSQTSQTRAADPAPNSPRGTRVIGGYSLDSSQDSGTPEEATLPELTVIMAGAVLTLTYNEALHEDSVPATDAFTVAVSGTAAEVSHVFVSGSEVTLALDSAVTSEDTVTVNYTAPTDAAAPRIQDEAGNPAASFSDQDVENNTPPPANAPATGEPTISGTAQVGDTLTVETSAIDDADGVDNVSYSYQWLADDVDIAGATSDTYTLVDTDVGKAVRVKVCFTDDAENVETRTSAPTAAVVLARPGAPQRLVVSAHDSGAFDLQWEAPVSDGGSPIAWYKVQWKKTAGSWDTSADVSKTAVTGTTHTITGLTDGVEYAVRVIATNSVGDGPPSKEVRGTPGKTTPTELVTATVDGATLTLTYDKDLHENSEPSPDAFSVTVGGTGRAVDGVSVSGSSVMLTLGSAVTSEDAVTVSYTVPADRAAARIRDLAGNVTASFTGHAVTNNTPKPNSPATGAPTISGTAQVGETLAADISGIGDDDGLPAESEFDYQWIRNDGSTDANIAGATDSTYVLRVDDVGKFIKVQVTFTDKNDYTETLTSAATTAVDPAPGPITGFTVVDASDQSVEGALADGGTLALDDPVGGSFGIRADLESGATIGSMRLQLTGEKTHDQTENIAPYSLYGDSGGNLSGESLPVGEYTLTATAYSEARLGGDLLGTLKVSFSVTETATQQPNSPATGLPTISGTAQVGETLTVDTSGIDDADGIGNATFSYQWIAGTTDISGATGSSYAPSVADLGKTIKVRVSFMDGASNVGDADQRGHRYRHSRSHAADGRVPGRAGQTLGNGRFHLRNRLQRAHLHQLQDPAGRLPGSDQRLG